MRALTSVSLWAAAWCTTACLGAGDPSDGGLTHPDADIDAGTAGPDDAGIWPDARALERCSDPVPPETAQVLVRQTDLAGLDHNTSIALNVPRPEPIPQPPPTGCLDHCMVGPHFIPDAGVAADSGAGPPIQIGTLTVIGLRTGTVALEPDYYKGIPGLGFTSGERLYIAATGSPALPAFSGTLDTPPEISFTPPTSADRAHDLSLRWTVASTRTAGLVEVSWETLDDRGGRREGAVCSFPLSAGVGHIPKEILHEFWPGNSLLTIRLYNEANVSVGTSTVNLSAESYVIWGSTLELH
ncbi:MAG: hypothetical protein U1E65_09650 [Myxococcota bacterium]